MNENWSLTRKFIIVVLEFQIYFERMVIHNFVNFFTLLLLTCVWTEQSERCLQINKNIL